MVAEKKTVCRSLGVACRISLDVVAETHVEHHVHLVEDDHLDRFEPQRAAPHVVHHAARRADDDLRALLEAAELAFVGLAAVNRQRVMPRLKSASLWTSSDTCTASSRVGQRMSTCTARRLRVGLLDGGNGERGGLAGAGLRLADDVLALHQDGDGRGLDRRGLFKAQFINGLQQFGGKAEFGK